MGTFTSSSAHQTEAAQQIGLPTGEIYDIFIADDQAIYWGNEQDTALEYDATLGQMLWRLPTDAGVNEPIINIFPGTVGEAITSPATVFDIPHATLVLFDSGVTDAIAFYNDDSLSHVLSEVVGGVEIDIALWLGDATGDQAKLRFYGYDETATAAAYYHIGTHDDGNNLLSLQIGLLTTTAGTENLVICDVGDTPALNVAPLNSIAHPKLSVWSKTAGAGDWLVVYNDDSNSYIRTGAGGIFFDAVTDGTGVDIRFEPKSTPVIDLGADVFPTGTFITVGYDTANTLTGDLFGLDIDLQTNVTGDTGADVYGYNLNLPPLTQSAANTTELIGYRIETTGALIQDTLGGVIRWKALEAISPVVTQTTGSISVNIIGADMRSARFTAFAIAFGGPTTLAGGSSYGQSWDLKTNVTVSNQQLSGFEMNLPTAGALPVSGMFITSPDNSGETLHLMVNDSDTATYRGAIVLTDNETEFTGNVLFALDHDGLLDLNPRGTGAQNVIDITPPTTIQDPGAGTITWRGLYQDLSALDPLTGAGASYIRCVEIQAMNFVSADGDSDLVGFKYTHPASDTSTSVMSVLTELTASKTQIAFYSFGGTIALSATGTYRGLHVDYNGLTRDANTPVIEGIRIDWLGNYTGFGTSYALIINDGDWTQSTAATTTKTISSIVGGALTQDTLAGTMGWVGQHLSIGNVTQTTGLVNPIGLNIDVGSWNIADNSTTGAVYTVFQYDTPALTHNTPTLANIATIYGQRLTTAGAIVNSVGNSVTKWYGNYIITPDITQTAGGATTHAITVKTGVYTSGTVSFLKFYDSTAAIMFDFISKSSTVIHPTMRIYDSGGTDYIEFYDDDAYSYISSSANPIAIAPSGDIDDFIQFSTLSNVPGFGTYGGSDMDIQNRAVASPYDVTFFANQTDPGTDAIPGGAVPEIRIYGWDHVASASKYMKIGMVAVKEGVNPDNNEYAYAQIGLDPTSCRVLVISDSTDDIQIAAAQSNPTFRIYDAGGTDFFEINDTGSLVQLHSSANGIAIQVASQADYISFTTPANPGFTSIGDVDMDIQNQGSTNPFDVTFFARQTVPTSTPNSGETPEIRIYGWSSATINAQVYSAIWTGAVSEGHAETNNEIAVMHIQPANNLLMITDQDVGVNLPEMTTAPSSPTLRIYDGAASPADFIQIYQQDAAAAVIHSNQAIVFHVNDDVDDYLIIQTINNVAGINTGGTSDFDLQNRSHAAPFDVTFFANQTDPGTDVVAAGEVPEIRIYGWQHVTANEGMAHACISVVSVGEGANPDDDEYAYLKIGVPSDDGNSRDSRTVVICDYDDTPEKAAVSGNPVLAIYDAGATDWIYLQDSGSLAMVGSNSNPIAMAAKTTASYLEFDWTNNVPSLEIGLQAAFTGTVTTQAFVNIVPSFTLTEPAAGVHVLAGGIFDMSNITVTAGAGDSDLHALILKATASANDRQASHIYFADTTAMLFSDSGIFRFRDEDDTDDTCYLEISAAADGTYVSLSESGNTKVTEIVTFGFVDSRPTAAGTHGVEIHGFNGVAAGAAGKGRLNAGAGTVPYFTVTGATDETNHATMYFDLADLTIDTNIAADFTLELYFDPAADGDKFDIAILDDDMVFVSTTTITASGAALQWSTAWQIGDKLTKGEGFHLYITKCTDSARTGGANNDFYKMRLIAKKGFEFDSS